MAHDRLDSYLIPPPRLWPAAEMPPHVDRLRLAPNKAKRPDEIEPFTPETRADPLTAERMGVLIKQTLEQPALRERLVRTRWTLIGAARRDAGKGEADRSTVRIVAYDYSHDVAVEATIDERSGELLGVVDAAYQPPPVESEIERAIQVARADSRLTDDRLADLVAYAIPLDPEAAGTGGNHRVIEVLFGCPQERLPRYRAIVDLSAERVVWAGDTHGCCGHKEDRP